MDIKQNNVTSSLELEDDWNPEIKKKDSILNKVVVNFTNKSIKKKNMIEERFEEEIFNNIQKHQNDPIPNNLNQSFESDENNENLMFDKAQIKENLKQHMKEENFYDPLLDTKEEEWTNKFLKKDKKSLIVLSCPYCFTQVCYDCQRHESYDNQYRALFVRNCKINCTKTINPLNAQKIEKKNEKNLSEEEKLEEMKEKCKNYFSVECCICNTEVGVYEADEKIYYFFHVIPGLG